MIKIHCLLLFFGNLWFGDCPCGTGSFKESKYKHTTNNTYGFKWKS